MEDTIKKFIRLPAHIRSAVSSSDAIARLEKIEREYGVQLANVVMEVTTRQLPMSGIDAFLETQLALSPEKAREVRKDLVHNIFSQIANYLGFKPDAGLEAGNAHTQAHEGSLGVDARDAEIEHHASKLKYEDKPAPYDADAFSESLMKKFNLAFDHVLAGRFKKLIESRLADAREKQDVNDRLTRPSKVGGLELSASVSDQIVSAVEQEHQRIHALHLLVKQKEVAPQQSGLKKSGSFVHPIHPAMKKPELPHPSAPKKPEPAMSPFPPEIQKSSLRPAPSLPGAPHVVPPSPAIPKPEPPKPKPQPLPETFIPQAPKKRVNVPHFMPKVLREQSKARPTVNDIILPSKLVGPIEELKGMAIQDFRKLGETTEESADRIREMIQKLEKESFERRSEGIKAWRSSELVKQYLDIGRESMEQNMNVARIISDRQAKGEDCMTNDEFDAVAVLNRSLRY